jgi:hypothetical protein
MRCVTVVPRTSISRSRVPIEGFHSSFKTTVVESQMALANCRASALNP